MSLADGSASWTGKRYWELGRARDATPSGGGFAELKKEGRLDGLAVGYSDPATLSVMQVPLMCNYHDSHGVSIDRSSLGAPAFRAGLTLSLSPSPIHISEANVPGAMSLAEREARFLKYVSEVQKGTHLNVCTLTQTVFERSDGPFVTTEWQCGGRVTFRDGCPTFTATGPEPTVLYRRGSPTA